MIDHYNAFISYRHAPLDSKVAAEIQTRLERFHIPRAIRKSSGIHRIDRIFRDKEELLITSDLNETIENALIHSDFLIVICSYATRESVWVQREIEFFLKTHSRKQILTVVAEGEPSEVVPQILLQQEVTVTLDSGEEDVAILPVEPLSCDYRGNFKKARKEELPRLAAAILGCSYDELKQRQRQYRARRRGLAFTAVALMLAALSVYYAWSASQIQKNYLLSLESQSQYLSAESTALLQRGDRISAMLLALEALPKDEEDPRPVLPEAEFALSQAVNAYVSPNTNWYAVEYAFPHGGTVDRILTNRSESHLIVCHSSSTLTVWEVGSREKVFEQVLPNFICHGAVSFDDRLLVLSSSTLYCYDYRTGDVLWQLDGKNYQGGSCTPTTFALSENSPVVALTLGDYLVTADTATGKILQEIPLPTYEDSAAYTGDTILEYDIHFAKFSPDNQKLFLHLSGKEDRLALCDLSTGEITLTQFSFATVDDAFFAEDGSLILIGMYTWRNGNYWIEPLYYYEDAFSEVVCLNPDGSVRWVQEIHYTEMAVGLGDEVIPFTYQGENGPVAAVACVAGEKLVFLDTATGDVLKENAYTAAIVKLALFPDHFSATLTDGMIGQYLLASNRNMAADFCIEDIDLAEDNQRLFVSDSETGTVLLYAYGLHDSNWTPMKTVGTMEDAFFTFQKLSAGNTTLLTRGSTLTKPFAVIDSAARTVRIFTGIPDALTQHIFCGLSPDGKALLFRSGALSDAVSAFLPETGVIVDDYYRLTVSNCASDAFVASGDELFYAALIPDENGELQKAFIRQHSDGSIDRWPIQTADPEGYFSNEMLLTAENDAALLRDSFYGGEGHYYALDMKTGSFSCTENITIADSQAVWAADGSRFFATDENCIRVFDRSCKELYRIACNGMTPNSLFASGEDLFVLYGTNAVYRYRSEDGAFRSKIDVDAGSSVIDCRWDDSQPGTLALFNNDTLNLIDTERWVVRTQVADCVGFCLRENLIFTAQSGQDHSLQLGYYTLYKYQDLIDIAKAQLGDAQLTAQMRSQYGLS